MREEENGGDPLVVTERRAADPGTSRAGIKEQVPVLAVAIERQVVVEKVGSIIDQEVFAGREN